MGNINDINKVSEQYSTPQNLDIRISIHEKYSTNKLGFGNWIYNHYEFFDGCKILELGCGNGNMWTNKTDVIGDKAELILSDLSDGMLDEAKIKLGKYNNIQFKKIDIMDIPYEDETFDFVIANMMLYHVPDLPAAIAISSEADPGR